MKTQNKALKMRALKVYIFLNCFAFHTFTQYIAYNDIKITDTRIKK